MFCVGMQTLTLVRPPAAAQPDGGTQSRRASQSHAPMLEHGRNLQPDQSPYLRRGALVDGLFPTLPKSQAVVLGICLVNFLLCSCIPGLRCSPSTQERMASSLGETTAL